MSATATDSTATPIAQPEVTHPTGSVEASDAFKDASETKETSPVQPTSAVSDSKPADVPPVTNGDTVAPSQEQKLSKKETQIIATPITKGSLGYKAPGIVNQLRFKSAFCELGGEEPVHIPKSGEFFRGEKPDIANRTAAWSGQHGKGLLYIYKAEDTVKNAPGSVLNLADATSIAKEGDKNFSFRLDRHKHTFEAKTQDERNGWLAALGSASESAAKSKDEVLNSQGYKDNMEKLKSGKSTNEVLAASTAGAVAAGGATAAAATYGDRKEEKADKKEEKAESKAQEQRHKSDALGEKKKSTKSRSRSNKRSSIFGGIMGKKDEKKEEKEEKKEDKAAATAAKKEEKEASKEEQKAEKDEKKEEKNAVAAIKKEEKQEEEAGKKAEKEAEKEVKKAEKEVKKEEKEEQKAAEKEVKKEEKEAKKEEKEDKKDDSKHEGEAAAAVGAAGVGATAAGEHKKSEKGKENAKTDDGTEKAQSKRKSIFGIFDKAKSPRAEKKESEVMPITPATPATGTSGATGGVKGEAKKAEEKVVDAFKDDPVSADDSTKKETTAVPAAGAASKEIKDVKDTKPAEAKTNGVKTDEATSPTGTSKRTSILGSVFRRPSKQAKNSAEEAKKEEKKAVGTPATVPETSEVDKAVTDKAEVLPKETKATTGTEPSKSSEPSAIGDVVPDAVNTGVATEPKPVASTA